jgi:hypothetical protein
LEDCKNYCEFKNALSSVKTPKKRARPENTSKTAATLTNTTSTANINETSNNINKPGYDSELNDCLSQYLNVEAALLMRPPPTDVTSKMTTMTTNQKSTNNTPTLLSKLQSCQKPKQIEHKVLNSFNTSSHAANSTTNLNTSSGHNLSNVSTSTIRKPTLRKNANIVDGVFQNKKFQILGFQEADLDPIEKTLLENGASIISHDANLSQTQLVKKQSVADYTIFPMTIATRVASSNPATLYWIVRDEIFPFPSMFLIAVNPKE